MIDFPDYNPAEELEVTRRNRREEIGVRIVACAVALILGMVVLAGVSAFVQWLFG